MECYKRGCVCAGCFYKDFFTDKNQKCRMKNAVLTLVEKTGIPESLIKTNSENFLKEKE
ncbi:hypothetical protein IJI31_01075 [bacterium]|nr:hypothetical protein [bacterium]